MTMAKSTKGKSTKYPRDKILDLFKGWFETEPSIHPPNLEMMAVWKADKIVRDNNQKKAIVRITEEEYNLYNAVDAKYNTIVYEFVPMGKRQTKLEASGDYILKIKTIENTPWSFGSCHACWKNKERNFTNSVRTPHPYHSKINDPNLSVMGGYGHVICNGCVMGVEKCTEDKDRCSPCPYCGHTNAFPKDLRKWCILEQVEMSHKRKMQTKEMKKMVDESGVTPHAIHFSADGNIRYDVHKKGT
jgi:hypothetical protein